MNLTHDETELAALYQFLTESYGERHEDAIQDALLKLVEHEQVLGGELPWESRLAFVAKKIGNATRSERRRDGKRRETERDARYLSHETPGTRQTLPCPPADELYYDAQTYRTTHANRSRASKVVIERARHPERAVA